jgi:hypothetical protein
VTGERERRVLSKGYARTARDKASGDDSSEVGQSRKAEALLRGLIKDHGYSLSSFSNSDSVKVVTFSSMALSAFEPGSVPTTT